MLARMTSAVGMLGASRGGMQTYLALKQTDKVKAVAVIAGVADLTIRSGRTTKNG